MESPDPALKPQESFPVVPGAAKRDSSEWDEDEDVSELPGIPTSGSLWVKSRDFIGVPSTRDFRMNSVTIPKPNSGEILIEATCWSLENYMRDFHVNLGSTMIGEQVGIILASRNKEFPRNSVVVCPLGWRTHSIVNPEVTPVTIVPDIGDLPPSLCLGVLGPPGLCAYFGFMEICQPKPGDIVLVNAAAGSVGSVVGQLAKHVIGCTVIAFAASKERCAWIRELGFDYVYHKSVTVSAALARQAPNGVDCFFDCVGASFTQGAVGHMKPGGTIVMCGYNSTYGRRVRMERRNDPYRLVCMHGKKVTSCYLEDFKPRWPEAQAKMLDWINQGKLKFHQTCFYKFENLPGALTALYDGSSVGSVVVHSKILDSSSFVVPRPRND